MGQQSSGKGEERDGRHGPSGGGKSGGGSKDSKK